MQCIRCEVELNVEEKLVSAIYNEVICFSCYNHRGDEYPLILVNGKQLDAWFDEEAKTCGFV